MRAAHPSSRQFRLSTGNRCFRPVVAHTHRTRMVTMPAWFPAEISPLVGTVRPGAASVHGFLFNTPLLEVNRRITVHRSVTHGSGSLIGEWSISTVNTVLPTVHGPTRLQATVVTDGTVDTRFPSRYPARLSSLSAIAHVHDSKNHSCGITIQPVFPLSTGHNSIGKHTWATHSHWDYTLGRIRDSAGADYKHYQGTGTLGRRLDF